MYIAIDCATLVVHLLVYFLKQIFCVLEERS